MIAETVAAHPPGLVLDIGAGCGLLSMMAVEAGAARVVGCEAHAAICAVGNDIVRLNGFADRITLVDKDCRRSGSRVICRRAPTSRCSNCSTVA